MAWHRIGTAGFVFVFGHPDEVQSGLTLCVWAGGLEVG